MAPVVRVYSISTVLLVSQDEDFPPEVQAVSEQLSSTQTSDRDVAVTLILHAFQAALGTELDLQALHTALQVTDRRFDSFGCTTPLYSFPFPSLNKLPALPSGEAASGAGAAHGGRD